MVARLPRDDSGIDSFDRSQFPPSPLPRGRAHAFGSSKLRRWPELSSQPFSTRLRLLRPLPFVRAREPKDALRVPASRGIAARVKGVGLAAPVGLCFGLSADSTAFRAFRYVARRPSTIALARSSISPGLHLGSSSWFRRTTAEIARHYKQVQRSRMSLLPIRPRTPQPNGVARLPKAVANSNDRARGDYVTSAMEAPLPLT